MPASKTNPRGNTRGGTPRPFPPRSSAALWYGLGLLILLGLVNAALYHRVGHVAALAAEARMPVSARVAGPLSLAIWIGVMVCASLNTEAAPKVLLR